ncbi:glucose-6-phosphate 1-dehydrogenase, cytoplasmic isoform-like [Arachis hypogaea]|uniref:glucose-6-phosphate 1-dehydrogenase, cytoplasmic isoform-like n=1 Tax=Arachis hypogaea TaxID=3818 RepID=UPI003B215AD2
MERPVSLNPEHIRDERVKVLESVVPISDDEVVLGQYEGCRDDPIVPDESNTPTFASVILRIHNERWEGVPFILKAGKALNSRKTEIRVQFKDVPHEIFQKFSGTVRSIEEMGFVSAYKPLETTYMKLMVYDRLRFDDSLYLQARIRGDQQQFVRRDELEASWKIFTPLLHRIDRGEFKPLPYEAYGRGPKEADELLRKAGYVETPIVVWLEECKFYMADKYGYRGLLLRWASISFHRRKSGEKLSMLEHLHAKPMEVCKNHNYRESQPH